jgi:hypothetical protein
MATENIQELRAPNAIKKNIKISDGWLIKTDL